MTAYVFENLHFNDSWLSPGTLVIDDAGCITSVEAGHTDESAKLISGLAIPGMANLHSHAFQRAMLGLTEFRSSKSSDSFWTWRERMYQLALTMSPKDLEAIAAQLYVEMLASGITSVGEFHYLHHDFDGSAYSNCTQMSERIFAAAHSAGMSLTHLPVLYVNGGFGLPTSSEQRRFSHRDLDSFMRMFEQLQNIVKTSEHNRLGVAPHSLRAVNPECLHELVSALDTETPIHIHIAEQIKEVEDSIQYLGARPVEWLYDNFQVNERWCLVHATHLDSKEIELMAKSHAVAGLCPTTEANLGDGIFPARSFLESGGRFGIGTDSQVNVSVNGELRLLEYGQRLRDWERNVLASSEQASVGRRLFDAAAEGGAKALSQPIGKLSPGFRADIVVLDLDHPRLYGQSLESVLDAWIFGHVESGVRDVMVAGQWQIQNGEHVRGPHIFQEYQAVVRNLWNDD